MGAASEIKDVSFSQYFVTNFLKQHIVFNKKIAKLLNIQHFSTIVFYKNGKEVARGIGDTNKSRIYSL